jgi:hypothetical protein
VGVGRNGVNIYAQFLEFFVVVSHIAQFSRANESEVSRIEEEHAPATFGVFLSDFYEFAVFESLVFKRFDFGVN